MFAPYSIDVSFRREGWGGMDYLPLTTEQRRQVFPTCRMETGKPVSTQFLKKIMVPSEGRRDQQKGMNKRGRTNMWTKRWTDHKERAVWTSGDVHSSRKMERSSIWIEKNVCVQCYIFLNQIVSLESVDIFVNALCKLKTVH